MQQRVTASPETSTWPAASMVDLAALNDGRLSISAPAGSWAIDVIRGLGSLLEAECEGRCRCASRHVRIAGEWVSRTEVPDAEELAELRGVRGAGPTSRLICRLILTPDLDGLDIEIDPWSLVPQTYRVAG